MLSVRYALSALARGAAAAERRAAFATATRGPKRKDMTLSESIDIVRARDARKQAAREAMIAKQSSSIPDFDELMAMRKLPRLTRGASEVLQLNIGKLCNLSCHHCHVEAGPTRKAENMDGRTVERCLDLLKRSPGIHTVDITGGAPELNPHFRSLVTAVRALGLKVIDRCNLSVLFQPGQEDTATFLASQGVHIIASMPALAQSVLERQRGKDSFDSSIRGLKALNAVGYGKEQHLQLDLIHNPDGAQLPGQQASLEAAFKEILDKEYGIAFNRLLTIANMPVKRFADDLARTHQYGPYMSLLALNFNPATLDRLMCKNTVSVSWDGSIYDCDFNQQLGKEMNTVDYGGVSSTSPLSETQAAADDLHLATKASPPTIWNIASFSGPASTLEGRQVHTHKACYGCTAGAGSSCGGALL